MFTAYRDGSRAQNASRLRLLAGTALAGVLALSAVPALADDECGPPAPAVTCPAQPYPGGIHYRDTASMTLTLQSGATVGPNGGIEIENEGVGTVVGAQYTIVTEAGALINVGVAGDPDTGLNAGVRIYNDGAGTAAVENAATITTSMAGSHGIFAYTNGGTPGGATEVQIENTAGILVEGAEAAGIVGRSILGDVSVTHSGLLGSEQGDGIRVETAGGILVDVAGATLTSVVAGAEQGIEITQIAGLGPVVVNNTGIVHGDVNGLLILQAGPGATFLNNAGLIGGSGTAAAVDLTSAAGMTVGNLGLIAGNDLGIDSPDDLAGLTPADIDFEALALRTAGAGPATIDNDGGILGRVELLQVGALTFTNDGAFASSGDNTFNSAIATELTNNGGIGAVGDTTFAFTGAGTRAVINNGMVQVMDAADGTTGTAAFEGGLTLDFTNNGLIDMSNNLALTALAAGAGTPTNLVRISGDYIGGAGSQLGVDAELAGPGSVADELEIGGGATGRTSIIVTDRSNSPGRYNPQGIVIVTVAGTTNGNFRLDPASDWYDPDRDVLDKGFVYYDLIQQGGVYKLVGLPDTEAFEIPVFVTGAQTIFHETALEWLDRQSDIRSWYWRGQFRLSYGAGAGADLPARGVPAVAAAPVALPPAGPGIWAKAIGSWTERDSSGTLDVLGGVTADTSYKQDVFSIQGGVDFGREGVFAPGDVLVFGLMGGYIASNLDFETSATRGTYEGGTVGFSSTYLSGGFFWDTLYKIDFLDLDVRFPGAAGSGSADVLTYGSITNVGYRWDLGGWFVEPSATFAYAKTDIDDMTMGGVRARFPEADSLRGAVGLRVGGTLFDAAALRVEGSVMGRVWHEFSDDNKAMLENIGLPVTLTDSFEGTFGEIKGGLDLFSKTSSWAGFVNAGVKFNDEFTTATVKAGVRFQW